MSLIPANVIRKKRDGNSLSPEEIDSFVSAYAKGSLPDYQMSALLMAIVLNGMNIEEASALTATMIQSGESLTFSEQEYLPVDKHSTGGIGDKTSLIIAPLVAACGVKVPMMAGRGLGHTGGTLDKLESIPGFNVNLSLTQFQKQVNDFGCAIIGQTEEICPADRLMYSLRDVTATVESIPLICGSILSKKVAEGIKALVMDVKCGSGAFMKTIEEARELSNWLVAIAEKNGVNTTALITNMDQPLGRYVGNALEVWECLAIMKQEALPDGWSPKDFYDCETLSLQLSAEMLLSAGRTTTIDEALTLCKEALYSRAAYEKFCEMVAYQGGDLKSLQSIESMNWSSLKASKSGYLSRYNAEKIGHAAICLKAGRRVKSDKINHATGLICHKKIGDKVTQGDVLFSVSYEEVQHLEEAKPFLMSSIDITDSAYNENSLIFERITQ